MKCRAAAFGPATVVTAARRFTSTRIRSPPATATHVSPRRKPFTTRGSANSFCPTTPCTGQATPTNSYSDFCRKLTQLRRSWRNGIARRWNGSAAHRRRFRAVGNVAICHYATYPAQHSPSLFDPLVRERQQIIGNADPKSFCRLHVDDQLKLGPLLHWQLGRFCPV